MGNNSGNRRSNSAYFYKGAENVPFVGVSKKSTRTGPGQSNLGKTWTAYTEKTDPGMKFSNPDISGYGFGLNTKNLEPGPRPGHGPNFLRKLKKIYIYRNQNPNTQATNPNCMRVF